MDARLLFWKRWEYGEIQKFCTLSTLESWQTTMLCYYNMLNFLRCDCPEHIHIWTKTNHLSAFLLGKPKILLGDSQVPKKCLKQITNYCIQRSLTNFLCFKKDLGTAGTLDTGDIHPAQKQLEQDTWILSNGGVSRQWLRRTWKRVPDGNN